MSTYCTTINLPRKLMHLCISKLTSINKYRVYYTQYMHESSPEYNQTRKSCKLKMVC